MIKEPKNGYFFSIVIEAPPHPYRCSQYLEARFFARFSNVCWT